MDNFNPNTPEYQRFLMDRKILGEGYPIAAAAAANLGSSGSVVGGIGGSGNAIASSSTSVVPSGSNTVTTTSGSSTTTNMTEFTKRKNWSQRIIEELKDFLHVISPTGKLMYCSPSSTELVGYTPEELVNRSITDFIHVDDVDMFLRDFSLAIQNNTSFTLYYRFRKKDDKFIILEVNGHPYFDENNSTGCKCFFSMGRAYPSKTTAMLDSFLELKVENENLRRQLRELIGPSETPAEASGSGSVSGANTTIPTTGGSGSTSGAVIPELNDTSNPLEYLTGLRFQEGERARGISTGSNDPTLLNESLMDVDMASSLSAPSTRDDNLLSTQISAPPELTLQPSTTTTTSSSRPRKKKKPKVEEEEYVCTDCGTVESPEWRKGPLGPKTLCNACGLRWAKKAKRQASGGGGNGGSSTQPPPPPPGVDTGGCE